MKEECQKNPKCFTVSFMQSYGFGTGPPYVYTHYFCQNHIVSHYRPADSYGIRSHTLPLEVMITIKHFQISSQDDHMFYKGIDFYNKHPHYFQDHTLITLQQKVDENTKRDARLTISIAKVEQDKKAIQSEKERLLIEQSGIELLRDQLYKEKEEFEKKKQSFDLEQKMFEKEQTHHRAILQAFRKDLHGMYP